MSVRNVEVYSAGCPACEEAITLVSGMACGSCRVTVKDMREPPVAREAARLGIRSLPAVRVDGVLADCCRGRGPDEALLRAAGVGQPRP
jgi:hypothetical protein